MKPFTKGMPSEKRTSAEQTVHSSERSGLAQLTQTLDGLLDETGPVTDYHQLTEIIRELSGAKFAAFNLFDADEAHFTTVALTGEKKFLQQAGSALGFNPVGKRWDPDPGRQARIEGRIITRFASLRELAGGILSSNVIALIEKLFLAGEVLVIRITCQQKTIGDFTLIMPWGTSCQNLALLELYARQIALLIARTRVEEDLKRSHREYASLVENSPDLIVRFNSRLQHTFCNSAVERQLGFPPETFLGKTLSDLAEMTHQFGSDLCRIFRCLHSVLHTALETGTPQEVEHAVPLPTGRTRRFQLRVVPERDTSGAIVSLLAVSRDLTDYHRIEEENQQLRTIFERANYGAAICDLTGKLLAVNPCFAHLHGYLPSELIGAHLSLFHSQEQMQEVKIILQELLAEGQFNARKVWHQQRDGSVFPMLMNGFVISGPTGEPLYLAATAIDISDRVAAQHALLASEERYRLLFDHASVGIVVVQGNTIRFANPMIETLLGYSREAITTTPFLEFVHPDHRQASQENYLKFFQPGGAPNRFPVRITTRDHQVKWLEFSGVVIPWEDQPALLGFIQDITERKLMEDTLSEKARVMAGVIDGVTDILCLQNPDLTIEQYNKAGYELLGMTPEQTRGKKCHELIGRNQPCYPCATQEALTTKKTVTVEKYFPELNSYLACRSNPILSADGRVIQVIQHLRDITEQKNLEYQIRAEHDYMFRIFDSMKQYVIVNSPDYTIEFFNQAAQRDFGDLVGETCYRKLDRETPCPNCPIPQLLEQRETGPVRYTIEAFGRVLEGSATRLINPDHSVSVLEVLEDVTERVKAQDRIRYLSFHDSLTGLYNRLYLEEEMNRLESGRQLPMGIIMADLNGLKLINDAFGHPAGDRLLKATAQLLRRVCRSDDLIARWGGDEFLILLPRTSQADTEAIAQRITQQSQEIQIENLPLSLALGTAVKSHPSDPLTAVFKEAEDRMYRNKLAESRSARSAVLSALRETLRSKSFDTGEHAERTMKLALRLGEAINLSGSDLDRLALLVSLHDIGKIALPESVLDKPGPLTEQEWVLIRKHPEIGYRIARSTDELSHVAEEILCHHERWDGQGYPQGLKGTSIPLLSRLNFIVDAFDAMTNHRPYRKAMSDQTALTEIRRHSGTQFDPELVKQFLRIFLVEG